ncbi:MAG: hypothetical protein HYV15_05540 [Elusimicrobia bacterium]|nr:hypothetical protein [Elusimicrobiota bacterium]
MVKLKCVVLLAVIWLLFDSQMKLVGVAQTPGKTPPNTPDLTPYELTGSTRTTSFSYVMGLLATHPDGTLVLQGSKVMETVQGSTQTFPVSLE